MIPYRNWLLVTVILLVWSRIVPARAQSAVPASPNQVRADLKEILHHSEFQPDREPRVPQSVTRLTTQLERAWDGMKNLFRRLFRVHPGSIGSVGPVLVYCLIFAFVVLAGWLLALVMRNRVYKQTNKNKGDNPTVDTDADTEPSMPPDTWLIQAKRLADNRDYRGAFRAVFVAILMQLDLQGAITYERSKTNGDYLRLLKTKSKTDSTRALYEALLPLAREFDLHWYGNRQTTEEDYQRCLRAYSRFNARDSV